MKFKIDEQILEKFSDVKVGLLVIKGLNNTGNDERIAKETTEVIEQIKQTLKLDSLVDHPKINDWRQAYISFGAKPKTYKNSVEALLKRVLRGETIPNINKIVDIYNMISIKYILPAGGDNIDNVNGDITLTIAKGGEDFFLLGSRKEDPAIIGEVIYRDDKEVLCRRWNWRECDKTKMEDSTQNVCLVLEGLSSTTKEELTQALEELKEKIQTYCGGKSTTFILDKDNNSVEIN